MILAMREPVDIRTTHRGRLLTVEVLSWTDESGRAVEREVVRHPGAVVIVPWLADGRLVLIRRVWLGPPPERAAESQVAFYKSFASQQAQSTWVSDELLTEDSSELLAERLLEALEGAHSDALNLRLHAQGVAPDAIRAQIESIGREVIPRLRAAWRA